MAAETSKTTQVALRMPKEWIPRADRLAGVLGRPGMDVGRSDVLRMALARGFEALEAEAGLSAEGNGGKAKAKRTKA